MNEILSCDKKVNQRSANKTRFKNAGCVTCAGRRLGCSIHDYLRFCEWMSQHYYDYVSKGQSPRVSSLANDARKAGVRLPNAIY